LSGQALSYDLNGNLLSDGQRNYTWDAENRAPRNHLSRAARQGTHPVNSALPS
jgi:uncharacterized protein RhaS with RHS repeats